MATRSWIRNLCARMPTTARKGPPCFRPRVEALEERLSPSTFSIINLDDNLNPGSLRHAIIQANANPGHDTINLYEQMGAITVPHPGTITLGGTPLPTITDDLTINGLGDVTLSGNDRSRVLVIDSGVSVNLSRVTIANGFVSGNGALGGAIFNAGTLNVSRSTITSSRVGVGGSDPFVPLPPGQTPTTTWGGFGGGIYNLGGTLTITDSTISGNEAAGGGGGIANLGTLTITNSTISNNQAVGSQTAQGGGIVSFLGTIGLLTFTGSVTLDRVTLEGNTARGLDSATNTNGVAAEGGGLYAYGGPVTIVDSTIRNNTAEGGDGGAGSMGADGTTPDPLLSPGADGGHGVNGGRGGHGGAASGGGLFFQSDPLFSQSGALVVLRSTISGNTARGGAGADGGDGGAGAAGNKGRAETISLGGFVNAPAQNGGRGGWGGHGGNGGDGGDGSGGGLHVSGGLTQLINSTVAHNQVFGGTGRDGGRGNNAGAGGDGGDTVPAASLNPNRASGDGGVGGNGGWGGNGGTGGDASGGGLARAGGQVLVVNTTLAYNQASSGTSGAADVAGAGAPGGQPGSSAAGGSRGSVGAAGVNGVNGVAGGVSFSVGGLSAGSGAVAPNHVILANSIAARNTANGGAASDLGGVVDPLSTYNLIGSGAGGLVNGTHGNLLGVADPRLGTLANNGGPTQTIAILPDSPARDAGDNIWAVDQLSSPLATDQRGTGFTRVRAGTVDIGAYELQTDLSKINALRTNVTGDEGAQAINFGTITYLGTGSDDLDVTASAGTVTVFDDNTWVWFYTPANNVGAPGSVAITAKDAGGAPATTTFTLIVNDVAPTVAISGAESANAGATFTLTLGAVTDPGQDTVTRYIVNWGDGTSDTYDSAGDKTHVYTVGGVTRTITVDLIDEDGTHLDRANALSVTVNKAPTLALPAAQTAYEDVDRAIRRITVGDLEGGNLTVNLAVGRGKLTLRVTTGLTVTGNGTGAVSLAGSIANLNAALAALVYRGNLNISGADLLRVTVSDGSASTPGSVALTIKSAAEQAADLRAQVTDLHAAGVLTKAQARLMYSYLTLGGNSRDARKVRSFLDLLANYSRNGILTPAQADDLRSPGTILLLSVTRR